MNEFRESDDKRSVIKDTLCECFDGKIVRKDLTKKIKEGANVLVYVLEFLLGQYQSECGRPAEDQELIRSLSSGDGH